MRLLVEGPSCRPVVGIRGPDLGAMELRLGAPPRIGPRLGDPPLFRALLPLPPGGLSEEETLRMAQLLSVIRMFPWGREIPRELVRLLLR